MRIPATLFLILALMMSVSGKVATPTLFVYCAAGMRVPVELIARQFEQEKGCKVELTYDGSNKLLGQIKLTHKGDVYIAGDADYMDMAVQDSLAYAGQAVCWFVPVIMVQKGNPKGIKTLADCAKPGVKLGQGDDKAAAVGRLMPKLLALNGIDSLQWKRNVALVTATVNELGMAVKLGTIDATVVWDAIANSYKEAADVINLPASTNITPEVEAGILKFTKTPSLAKQFVEYLISEKGKSLLRQNGYTVEKPVK